MEKYFFNKKVLSVVIPAYNNPAYLTKCLNSIRKQSYENLEIIISDDCSNPSLEKVVNGFKNEFSKNTKVIYYYHKENLGIYWNLMFAFGKAKGEFLVFMQHDDWFTDDNFFLNCIKKFEDDKNIKVVIGNSESEKTKQKSLLIDEDFLKDMDGSTFVNKNLFRDMFPIFSAVIYRMEALIQTNYKDFFVGYESAEYLEVEIDECFAGLILAASSGKVSISGKIICIRGEPDTAATKLNLHLLKKKGRDVGMFIPYYKLYSYFLKVENKLCEKEMIRLMIKEYPVRHINFKVLSYLGWEFKSIILMHWSFFYRVKRKLLNLINV